MCDMLVVLRDDGRLALAIKVFMRIHLKSDSVRAAMKETVRSHSVLVGLPLVGTNLK